MERPTNSLSEKEMQFPSVKEARQMMDKGISLDLFLQRIRRGWDFDKAKTFKPRKHDSIDNYKQFSDFELEHILHHIITYTDYKNRRKLGWSREEAIFIPKGIQRYQVLNHDIYPVTRQELTTIYKNESTIDTYRSRMAMGWSKSKALTTPKKTKK
ncbi:hypothetical protein [Staphylococcus aureus]|uniref:hypothetical protein n=1 Tax=Staphylococcus aureus TaxID=1280 RepID=UPI0038B3F43D